MAKKTNLTPLLQDFLFHCRIAKDAQQKANEVAAKLNKELAEHAALLYNDKQLMHREETLTGENMPDYITNVKVGYNNGPQLSYEFKKNPTQNTSEKLIRQELDRAGIEVLLE